MVCIGVVHVCLSGGTTCYISLHRDNYGKLLVYDQSKFFSLPPFSFGTCYEVNIMQLCF